MVLRRTTTIFDNSDLGEKMCVCVFERERERVSKKSMREMKR